MSINLFKEFAMTQVINTPYFSYSTAQPRTPRARRETVEASRTLSGMLLAAVLSALLVVADQVIDTWVDGHMLAAWVALWTVAFAALALLGTPAAQSVFRFGFPDRFRSAVVQSASHGRKNVGIRPPRSSHHG